MIVRNKFYYLLQGGTCERKRIQLVSFVFVLLYSVQSAVYDDDEKKNDNNKNK